MKLIVLLALIPFFSFSQSYEDTQAKSLLDRILFYDSPVSQLIRPTDNNKYRALGVKKIILITGKTEQKTKKSTFHFNSRGLLTAHLNESDTTNYTYVSDSLVETISVRGKNESIIKHEYLEGKLIKKEESTKDRITSRILIQYNQENKIAFSMLQKGRKLKKNYALKYGYIDGELRFQEFIKNDRLLRRWDYSCEPKGEVLDEKKEILMCRYVEESNDGSYINYLRKVKNGEPLLYAYSYTKDSVKYASVCTRESGTKVWEATYEKYDMSSITYSKNGKIKRTSLCKYDNDHNLIEIRDTYGKKQNKESKVLATYNQDGTLSTSHSYNKGKMTYYRSYSYAMD